MRLNLVTPVGDSGYGTVGLGLLRGLTEIGVEVALFARPSQVSGDLSMGLDEVIAVRSAMRGQRDFDPDAACVRVAPEDDMTEFAGRGLRGGLSFYETTELTELERRHLGWLDRVLVPSNWARDVAVANGIDPARIRLVPMGVDAAVFSPAPLPEAGPTTFLNVAKWEHRKGQDVLLAAFERAFEPGDDVRLRLACHHPEPTDRDEEWQRRCAESPLAELIEIVPRQPTSAHVAAQMAAAHCGVFPARAEGWNLPLLEMLARGRPVIATDWGAHGAYLDADNARLVAVDRTEPAADDRWITVYSERKTGEWAHLGDAQVEQLADHLQQVHSARLAGRLERNEAGIATAARHSWAAAAEALVAAME